MKTLKEKIEVMQAALEGKPISCAPKEGVPMMYNTKAFNYEPAFNWQDCDYNVVPPPPSKKLVAMQPEDYPPVFWVRRKSYTEEHLLCVGFHGSWLKFASNVNGYRDHAATTYEMGGIDVKDPRPCEYSVDRKVWLPCVKEVDA